MPKSMLEVLHNLRHDIEADKLEKAEQMIDDYLICRATSFKTSAEGQYWELYLDMQFSEGTRKELVRRYIEDAKWDHVEIEAKKWSPVRPPGFHVRLYNKSNTTVKHASQ